MMRGLVSVILGLTMTSSFFGCTKKTEEASILHVDRNFTFPAGFPPDPGEAGRKTLAGIDSDRDGVRDDLQRWIYARYPQDLQKQRALRQLARSMQLELSEKMTQSNFRRIVDAGMKASDCLFFVFPNGVQHVVETEYMQAKVFNTKARAERTLETDRFLDGKVLGQNYDIDGSACEP